MEQSHVSVLLSLQSKKWCEKFVNRINKKNKMKKLFDGKEPKVSSAGKLDSHSHSLFQIPASEKKKINAKCKGNKRTETGEYKN